VASSGLSLRTSQRRPEHNVARWLDLSRKRLDVCLLSEHGELVDEFSVPPDADGLRGLVRHVAQRITTASPGVSERPPSGRREG